MDWTPLWISLNATIPATIITFFLGIGAAQKVVKSGTRISRMIDVIFTLPLVLPPTVVGFLLLMLLGRNGIVGKPLMNLGVQIVFTRSAAVLAAIVVAFPLMYRSAKAAFEHVAQQSAKRKHRLVLKAFVENVNVFSVDERPGCFDNSGI